MLKPFHLARLREIVQRCVPFINHDGQIFVSMPEPRGLTLPLRSTEFRNWFVYKAVAHYETFPTPNAMNAIFNHLEALAGELPNGSPSVFRRVGFRSQDYLPTRILIDLANSQCQYVVIAPTGWKIDSGKQEYFETSRSTRPLPYPATAASPAPASEPPINCQPPFPNEPAAEAAAATPTDPQSLTPNPQPPILRPPTPALDALRALLNLPSRPAFLRVLAWLLAALRPTGPFPFLVLQGPPGSGKTFAAKILRSIFDPSTAPLSPIPATPRELYILARHNWILALDHVSTLSPALTDALCRLSSGVGVAVHETPRPTANPLLKSLKRPVILTVTERWSCSPALAERALTIQLPPLPPDRRTAEMALLTAFQEAWPAILATLCDAVGTALARLPQIDPAPGKFADAVAWAVAASPALGCTEDEMREALNPPPSPHPMVEAVRGLMEQRRCWKGSATELRDLFQPFISCHTAAGVSKQLRSCSLTLAEHGIELKFRRLHEGARVVEIREDPGDAWTEEDPPHASPDSDVPPQPTETEEVKS